MMLIGRKTIAIATAPIRPIILGNISSEALPPRPCAASRVHLVTSLRSTKKLAQVSSAPTVKPSAMSRGWVSAAAAMAIAPMAWLRRSIRRMLGLATLIPLGPLGRPIGARHGAQHAAEPGDQPEDQEHQQHPRLGAELAIEPT